MTSVSSWLITIVLTLVWVATGHASSETTKPELSDAPTCIAVVGSNDLHGQLEPESLRIGNYEVRRGGLLGFSGYLNVIREQFGDRVLILDAGDLMHGTYTANHGRGAAMIAGLNQLGFHASTIGNHEFDYGPRTPDAADRIGVLKNRIAEASFPFLGANITDRKTGSPIDWPNTRGSLIIELGNVRVGIIGLATPNTPQTTRPQNVTTLAFESPKQVVLKQARQLRRDGAQLIVALAHLGAKCEDLSDPNNLESCDSRGGLIELLNALPRGVVDIAIGGHTHSLAAHWINGVATLESGHRGRYFGWLKACVAPSGGLDRIHSTIHAPVATCLETWADGTCTPVEQATEVLPAEYLGHPVVVSTELQKTLAPFIDAARQSREKILPIELPRDLKRKTQQKIEDGFPNDSLGDVVAEGMRKAVNADVGIQNRGGVRADLPKGTLTFGQVYRVLPFGNHITTMQLTGAQLKAFIEHLLNRHEKPPYIAGLRIVRIDGLWQILHLGGSPIEIGRTYQVATNDYLAGGGEGLERILKHIPSSAIHPGDTVLLHALIEHLRSLYPPAPVPSTPAAPVVPPNPTPSSLPSSSSPG